MYLEFLTFVGLLNEKIPNKLNLALSFNVLTIIMSVTVIVSLMAFNNLSIKDRLMYNPYDVKHHKNYARILGHVVIHADYMHLAFNMLALYFLGSVLLDPLANVPEGYFIPGVSEGLVDSYGNMRGQAHFFTLYLGGALFATVIPYIRHQDNPSYRSLGASGAVSAVVFAAVIWNPGMNIHLFFIPVGIPAYIFGPLYLLFEYFADKRGNTGIAHDAHIGGALFGVIYILIINIDKGKEFLSYFI